MTTPSAPCELFAVSESRCKRTAIQDERTGRTDPESANLALRRNYTVKATSQSVLYPPAALAIP